MSLVQLDVNTVAFLLRLITDSHRRLITTECDKTIKIYKEDSEATPEKHPVDMRAWSTLSLCRKRKRY